MSDRSLPRHARNARPRFFEDAAIDKVMSVVLGLAQEVSVLRDRLDVVERVLDAMGTIKRDDLESYRPDAAAEAERTQRRADYLQRIFRAIRHDAGMYGSAGAEQYVADIERALQQAPDRT
jgi:hypothetical protein